MSILLSLDDALQKVLRRDWWLVLKIPVGLYLAWSFFLPQFWKLIILLVTGIVSSFMVVSPINEASTFHFAFMFFSLLVILYAGFWYVVYVFAYLAGPGVSRRIVGVVGAVISPVVVIAAALLVGGVGAFFGVPQERFWAHFDKWTPIPAWRTIQSSASRSRLDDAVRGDRPAALWQALDGDFKYVECLRHRVAEMRHRAGVAAAPYDLIDYYPIWLDGLAECAEWYNPDTRRAEALHEALVTEMAKVVGEETGMYLTMRRLYSTAPASRGAAEGDWLEKWRATALVGVAGTADVLESVK